VRGDRGATELASRHAEPPTLVLGGIMRGPRTILSEDDDLYEHEMEIRDFVAVRGAWHMQDTRWENRRIHDKMPGHADGVSVV
jgi:hypothetical protein